MVLVVVVVVVLLLLSFSFFCSSLVSSVHVIPWICSGCYSVASEFGMVYHFSTVSPYGLVLLCALFRTCFVFFSHRDAFFYSLFCEQRQDFREASY